MMITERIDAITGLTVDRMRAEAPVPRSVKIELTGRCNFACVFCARSMRLRDQKDMTWDLYTWLLRELREAGVEEIGLFYLGESFLVPWLPKAVHFAKHDVGFPYVFLTTNGSRATPSRVEACIRFGLDSLKFSMNYSDATQLHEIARVKPTIFREITENFREARIVRDRVYAETGHRCGLYASYIAYDGEQGRRMEPLIEGLRNIADEVYALPLYNQADLVSEEERARGWKPSPGNRGRLDALREPLPCWSVFNEGHITADGKLSACCFDHDGRFEMGDLTTTPFLEAWNSEKFRTLREAHLRRDVTGTSCA